MQILYAYFLDLLLDLPFFGDNFRFPPGPSLGFRTREVKIRESLLQFTRRPNITVRQRYMQVAPPLKPQVSHGAFLALGVRTREVIFTVRQRKCKRAPSCKERHGYV